MGDVYNIPNPVMLWILFCKSKSGWLYLVCFSWQSIDSLLWSHINNLYVSLHICWHNCHVLIKLSQQIDNDFPLQKGVITWNEAQVCDRNGIQMRTRQMSFKPHTFVYPIRSEFYLTYPLEGRICKRKVSLDWKKEKKMKVKGRITISLCSEFTIQRSKGS